MNISDFIIKSWDSEAPFTIDDLIEAKVLQVYGYREIMVRRVWEVAYHPSLLRKDNNSVRYEFEKLIDLQSLWVRHPSNHQGVLVEIKNKQYYVEFTDGRIIIGTSTFEGTR